MSNYPMRAVLALAFLVLFGGEVFWISHLCGLTLPTKAHDFNASIVLTRTAAPPESYPEFSLWVYSFELTEPLMTFDQVRYWDTGGTYWDIGDPGGILDHWQPNLIKLYQYIHIFIGHLLLLLIALSPTKLLRQD